MPSTLRQQIAAEEEFRQRSVPYAGGGTSSVLEIVATFGAVSTIVEIACLRSVQVGSQELARRYRLRMARNRFIWSVIATSVGRRSTLEAP